MMDQLPDSQASLSPAPELPAGETPAPVPKTAPPAAPKTDWGKVLRNILRTILGLIMAVIFGGLIGLGIFFGLPWLYYRYVLPVEQHEVRLDALETQYNQQVTALETSSSDQEKRIQALEAQLSDLSAALETYQTEQVGSQEQAAQDLAALRSWLDDLEKQLGQLGTDLGGLPSALNAQQGIVATLQADNQEQATRLVGLQREIALLKAMELLSRARLFLMQNNLGLAQLDMQAARDLLVTLRPGLNVTQGQALENIVQRLDLALQNLNAAPVLVVDDLEVAWQLLRRGLDVPVLQVVVEITPTPILPSIALTETLTLTPTLTITPTLTVVPELPTPVP